MLVSEIMTANPDAATAQDTVRKVAAMMDEGDYGVVPVVEDGRFIGVVTDRDIAVRAVAQGLGPDTPVSEVMSDDPVCIDPDAEVEEAAELMVEEQIRRLFVTDDDDRLIGVVSLGDIALEDDDELVGDTLEDISED
ncbi:MAG: hypothetical protein B7Z33_14025 [Sphingomonadales bacterium 12-68-11]|nr:MAG: hypothetical protein B7Z33_14025 [Sphingomonadales bacterium 12-68-11]OYX16818.1 MAG: hypothetical protein B7Z07_01910 [Sphingomonadales bacterium 32-67-7]